MEWVVDILKSYGLAGVVIAGLAYAVRWLIKSSNEVNNSRLGERDILIKALEANTTAIKENAKVTEARNIVTQDLAAAITKQAGAFEVFIQKTEFYQEALKEKVQDQKLTIEAIAESNRVNTGILRDVRDHIARSTP
jgi:hypothetical protein